MHVQHHILNAEAYTPPEQDLQDLGVTDPLQCPNCVGYLKQNHLFDAVYELSDQMMMAPAPGPMPDQVTPTSKAVVTEVLQAHESMCGLLCPTNFTMLSKAYFAHLSLFRDASNLHLLPAIRFLSHYHVNCQLFLKETS